VSLTIKGLAILCLIFELWMVALLLPRALEQRVDFPAFYSAGLTLRTNPAALYDAPIHAPYIHPAYEAIPFVALSLLSYRAAYYIFAVVNLLILLLIWRRLNLRWELLAFAPLSITILMGQDSIIFFGLLACAWIAATKGQARWAGLILGLSMFRFQNVLPIIALLLVWGQWNTVRGWAISATIMALVSAVLVSPAKYIAALSAMTIHPAIPYSQPIERMVNLRGAIAAIAPSHGWLLWPASIIVFAWCAWSGIKSTLANRLLLGITASALLSYHFFAHDLCVLLVPLAALIHGQKRTLVDAAILIMLAVPMLAVFNLWIWAISFSTLTLLFITINYIERPRLAVKQQRWSHCLSIDARNDAHR
jgi:hypothetical protein